VAEVIRIQDPQDGRLTDYLRLTDVRLRTRLEPEHGLFMAEGQKVIRRALGAGYPLRSMLITADRLAALSGLAESCPGPVYVVGDEVAEQLTGYRVHRGALAAMARRPLPTVTELLAGGAGGTAAPRRVVVLEDLVDHGNVGGIFRCAAALGVDAVILSPRCADPLYRRAIKVSMGAVFAIPYARMHDWRGGLAGIRAAGFRLCALTPKQSALPVERLPAGEPLALLLGTEGDGLSSRWLDQADQAVCIRMHPGAMARGVDSLNVVAAAAIACHELVREEFLACPASCCRVLLLEAARVEVLGGFAAPQKHHRSQANHPGNDREQSARCRARQQAGEQRQCVQREKHGADDPCPVPSRSAHPGQPEPQGDADDADDDCKGDGGSFGRVQLAGSKFGIPLVQRAAKVPKGCQGDDEADRAHDRARVHEADSNQHRGRGLWPLGRFRRLAGRGVRLVHDCS
jgi:tRNA G18 (ribose-2'-O)-methylase SpoU